MKERVTELTHSAARAASAAAGRPAGHPADRLDALAKEIRRFARGIVGSDAYDKYLNHHRVTGCPTPPMSEKDFWRAKYRDQDLNPRSRCC